MKFMTVKIIRSKNFSFDFIKNIGKFIILGRDIREIRRRLGGVSGSYIEFVWTSEE